MVTQKWKMLNAVICSLSKYFLSSVLGRKIRPSIGQQPVLSSSLQRWVVMAAMITAPLLFCYTLYLEKHFHVPLLHSNQTSWAIRRHMKCCKASYCECENESPCCLDSGRCISQQTKGWMGRHSYLGHLFSSLSPPIPAEVRWSLLLSSNILIWA